MPKTTNFRGDNENNHELFLLRFMKIQNPQTPKIKKYWFNINSIVFRLCGSPKPSFCMTMTILCAWEKNKQFPDAIFSQYLQDLLRKIATKAMSCCVCAWAISSIQQDGTGGSICYTILKYSLLSFSFSFLSRLFLAVNISSGLQLMCCWLFDKTLWRKMRNNMYHYPWRVIIEFVY